MPGLLELSGAQSKGGKPIVWGSLVEETLFEGMVTNRAPLHPAGSLVENKFYGGRPGALLGGKNIFLNNQLSLQRRPGHSQFSSTTWVTTPLFAFTFPQLDGSVRVIIDTGSSGNLAITSVAPAGAGSAVYQGTFPFGGSNAYAGLFFKVTGFTHPENNSLPGQSILCTASSTTTLTLATPSATAESAAAIGITAGGVWWDQQNGSKQFLFGKQPGAGQTGFTALAGILYGGDGVDVWSWNPNTTGKNGFVFSWGLAAPTAAPGVTITPSGSASVAWTAATEFTPMGLIVDPVNHITYQLTSVNASGTNTTQFGLTGNGQPAWNQAPGGTTPDGSITWTNRGPIVLWTANTVYNNASLGGTTVNPCIIYDPNTKSCFLNANPGIAQGKSGAGYPKFPAALGQSVQDGGTGGIKWFYIGTPGIPATWKESTLYPAGGSVHNNYVPSSIVEPTGLQNGLPTSPVLYWQVSGGGTSASSATSPFSASTALSGTQTSDGDLIWLALSSSVWAGTTPVNAWTAVGTAFTAIVDANGNFEVAQQTGVTATVQPGTSYTLTAAQANTPVVGQTTYTYSSTTAVPIGNGSLPIMISGFTNAGNNSDVTGFKIVSSTATSVVVVNAGGVNETHAGVGIYNPWQGGYGNTTSDGTAVWVNVGSQVQWTTNQKWYLPSIGFFPPSSADPYGGSSVIDTNSDVEESINSGVSGGSAPTWGANGTYTNDNGTSFTLSQVTVNADGSSTYTGTGLSGLAGQQLTILGFTNAGNNGLVTVLSAAPWAPTATTFHVKTAGQINETHAGTAHNGLIWYNLVPFSQNSLAWSFGLTISYAFKSRSLTDFYSIQETTTSAAGVTSTSLPIPPGLSNPLTFPPTGSQIGDLSSTSPFFSITGADGGAVITITGLGSVNPAVDTIVIYVSPDEVNGSSNMLEATEIDAPQPLNGIAQPWTFKYFLPFTPATIQGINYPGLNVLDLAPINGQNDPPPSGFVPFVYNFERVWGTYQNSVLFSQGPDSVGGNPNSQFLLADSFPFLANPTSITKSTQGLLVTTPSSFEWIAGGPATSSFYSVQLLAGLGVNSRNCVGTFGGEVFAYCSDDTFRIINPQMSLPNAGIAIEDLLANAPITGIPDAVWSSLLVNVAVLQNGNDNIIAIADGSTGYYAINPRQQTGSMNMQDPVWSPFASVVGGAHMVCVCETSPGTRQMLIGSPIGGQPLLKRDSTVFTDNGTQYDSFFILGSLAIARRGEIGIMRFVELDFSGVDYEPTVSYLLNEIYSVTTQNQFIPFTLAPQPDPPEIYGDTLSPVSYSANRYYFAGTGKLARANYLTLKVDLGITPNNDQVYSLTVNGAVLKGR
jgi:hypothetical protein